MNNFDMAAAFQLLAVAFLPMLLGIICHEVAHGWAAYKMGDPTAKMLGRLTLNPAPHLDPMGSMFFVITAVIGVASAHPFIFGWAKPVPINPRYFKDQARGMMISSLAGPLTNFTLAFIFATLFVGASALAHAGVLPVTGPGEYLLKMLNVGVSINVVLGCFNLIPVPPLDGSHVMAGLLPPDLAASYRSLERYGMLIVIVLLLSGALDGILGPLVWNISDFMINHTPFALLASFR